MKLVIELLLWGVKGHYLNGRVSVFLDGGILCFARQLHA